MLIGCYCAELEVLIDGQMGRTTSCVGENVTYVCNVNSIVHIWSSDSFAYETTIAGGSQDVIDANGFTFQRVAVTDDWVLISSVSVTSFSGLNGSMIQCWDGAGGGAEEQTITAEVYSKSYPNKDQLQNVDIVTKFLSAYKHVG